MTFVTVQQQTLLNDIVKTWINYLKDTWDFTWINFKVATPDTDIELALPLIVAKRVWNDSWSINRNSWYFWIRGSNSTQEKILQGYTYSSLMQFDIMTTTITECNKIQWLIFQSLEASTLWERTYIPLKTFSWVNPVWTATDLLMKFYFHKDVDWAVISSFDPNLHQHSVSVDFSIDYLSEVINPKILSTSFTYNTN